MRIALILVAVLATSVTRAAEHGVILMYHHVDANTPPSTSVSPEQFASHLDHLQDNDYQVLPLSTLLQQVYDGDGQLPERSVAITFDDAYRSVYTQAFPALARRAMPFTVFVATGAVDEGYRDFLSWQQIRDMQDSGLASFGAHSVSHAHLLSGLGEPGWKAAAEGEIDHSVQRLEKMLGSSDISSFAYPFGEWSPALADLLAERQLYGLAQHSGAIGPQTPPQAIPRFPMARNADLQRLQRALHTRPLPVTGIDAGPTFITGGEEPPTTLSFTLAEGNYHRQHLACYSASGEALAVARDGTRFTVELPALEAGRNKINCTAPSSTQADVYHWYSQQWVVADDAGLWLTR